MFSEPIILVFTLIIQIFLFSLLIISLKEQLNSGFQDIDKIFFILMFIVASYILTMFSFNIEAIPIKKELLILENLEQKLNLNYQIKFFLQRFQISVTI